jgi:hypothetical protein
MGKAILKEEQAVTSESLLKVTALLYFKEALQKQEYETCAELVAAARQNGAEQNEISEVIAGYIKGDKIEANKKRLRVI